MMQALLADRFHLVVHHETATLQPSVSFSSAPARLAPISSPIRHPTPAPRQLPSPTSPHRRGIPLSLLATSLPTMTGMATLPRPVVDQTGLVGLYDFTLHWTPDPDIGDSTAPFRGALKSQLGLELKPTHAPIDMLVIDHVERPAEN